MNITVVLENLETHAHQSHQAPEVGTPRLTCDKHTEVPVMNLTLEKCHRGGPQSRTLALTQVHFLLLVTHGPLQSGNSKWPIIWICIWQLCAQHSLDILSGPPQRLHKLSGPKVQPLEHGSLFIPVVAIA